MEGESELQLTQAQEDHLQSCFKEYDRDGSDTLDVKEFGDLMQVLGLNPSRNDVADTIARCRGDEDKSTLNYEEFRSLMIPIIEKAMREMRKGFEEAFREFDKDGNGKVDKDEFSQNYHPRGAVDDPMHCCPRPKAEVNSASGHPQHRGGDSFDCCTEREAVTTKGCDPKERMTDEEVDDLFEAVDIDGDGKLSCNEMIDLFCAVFEAWMDQQEGQGSQQGSRPGSKHSSRPGSQQKE